LGDGDGRLILNLRDNVHIKCISHITVKGKVVRVLNEAPRHEDVWGSEV